MTPTSLESLPHTPNVLAEVQAGQGVSLAEAVSDLPAHRGGGGVCGSTAWRWRTRGVRVPNGRKVYLEAVRVGGRWLTTKAAVGRFIRALTAAADAPDAVPPVRSPAARARDAAAADAELDRLGCR